MIKKDILELETRRKIYNTILNNPGLHIRKIQRQINIPYTSLKYHLNFLVKRNLISIEEYRNYTRYFIKNNFGNLHKKIISLLRQKTTNDIMIYLLVNICASRIELSKLLNKDDATVLFHLKKAFRYGFN